MAIEDRWSFDGMKVIFLDSDELSLSIIPEHGGVINSLKLVKEGTELLAQIRKPQPPSTYREGKAADNLLDLMLVGGWYEVLPNAGYVSDHLGTTFGLHDETPYLPWRAEYDSDRDPASVFLSVSLKKVPLTLSKRITVYGSDIILEEKITNHSSVRLPVSWLHHPMFGGGFIDEFASLELPDCNLEVDTSLPTTYSSLQPGFSGKWPYAKDKSGNDVNLSTFPRKGSINCDDLVYVPEVSEGRFKMINTRKGISFEALWDKEIFGSLWIWRPLGGGAGYPWFGRIYGTAVEITTSWPASGIAEQERLGTAFHLEPEAVTETKLTFRVRHG